MFRNRISSPPEVTRYDIWFITNCSISLIFDFLYRLSTMNQTSPFPKDKAKFLVYPQNYGNPVIVFRSLYLHHVTPIIIMLYCGPYIIRTDIDFYGILLCQLICLRAMHVVLRDI